LILRQKFLVGFVVGVLLVCPYSLTGRAYGETLLEALVDGYLYSSDVDAQLARLRRAVEAIRESKLADDMKLDLVGTGTGGYTESHNRTTEKDTSGISVVLNAELKATLPIIKTSNAYQIELRVASLEQERYTYDRVVTALFDAIVGSYNDVYTQQKKLDLFLEAEKRAYSQVEAASERFAVGQVTKSDVAQARALLAQAKSELLDAKTRLNLAWIRLSNLVGERYEGVEEPELDLALPVDEKEAVAWALSGNVEIALARAAVESGAINIELAESTDDARFDLTMSLKKAQPLTSNGLGEADSLTFTLGGTLTYPIFDGGRHVSQVSQAEIAYSEALDRLKQARLNAEREAESVVENVVAIDALLEANRAEIDAQTIALDGVKEEEIVGTRALVDVLNAERDLLLVKVRALDSESVNVSNRFSIYRVTGLLGYKLLVGSEASSLISREIVEGERLQGRSLLSN
jgi:outer membrane protein